MSFVFELLDNQPSDWPRWEYGREADDMPTAEQHCFLFEPLGYDGSAGIARAACQFIDGAKWVGRMPSPIDLPGGVSLCHTCMEISLQHMLSCEQA